jgi:glycine cleavage system regulatory protein
VKKDNFTKLEKSLRAYTAQQSLLRAKEELESITSPHKYEVWLKVDGEVVSYAGRLTQLDKEIKASRLDAEGGEKKQ